MLKFRASPAEVHFEPMRHARRRSRLAALLCAALHVGSSFALTADLVLCRTPSGHVEIESATSDGCCTAHGSPARFAGAPEADDCGCVDTPLLQRAIDQRGQVTRAASAPPHAVPVPYATPLSASPFPIDALAAARARPSAEALRTIRSVVLLV
jgi:hypothetical protein